jgi:acetolactate synthase I/III small subunit
MRCTFLAPVIVRAFCPSTETFNAKHAFMLKGSQCKSLELEQENTMNAHLQPTGSAYFIARETEKHVSHTLSVLVDNEPGVLARVIGLFSGRGYNIESLTVSETEHQSHLSRITIVTRGTPHVLDQIRHQLERIVPVHRVVDLSIRAAELGQENPLERELALVKVKGTGDARVEALRLADAFRASVIDANTEHFIFEITGKVSKIEQFIAIMRPLGLIEVCRTGVAAMNRGPQGM